VLVEKPRAAELVALMKNRNLVLLAVAGGCAYCAKAVNVNAKFDFKLKLRRCQHSRRAVHDDQTNPVA
jgi:hypothetical protein